MRISDWSSDVCSSDLIALEALAPRTVFRRQPLQVPIDFRQGLAPIDIGFARAEQIQIRAVQDQDMVRHCEIFMKTDRLFTLKSLICPLSTHHLQNVD